MTEVVEIWKSIPGFEGFYEVSTMGRIRSVDRYINNVICGSRKLDGKVLSLRKSLYLNVKVGKKGKRYTIYAHRAVAETFIPNPENKKQVNHIDGNSNNNMLSNLEWCTPRENQVHAVSLGLYATKKNWNKKHLARERHSIVCDLRDKGYTQPEIGKKVGLSQSRVSRILSRNINVHAKTNALCCP